MTLFSSSLVQLARMTLSVGGEKGLKLATAESCTGGLIAACLTEIEGSSRVFDRGFVTYTNEAKRDMLGVPGDIIADYGAVSEPVARAMAEGALVNSNAGATVAVTGIAGPDGGTPLKPVGLVHIACARDGHRIHHDVFRFGEIGRQEVRLKTVEEALSLLLNVIQS
jgi:nicotinamide-nucleotide amidase